MRGVIELDSGTNLLLNPAIKTFGDTSGIFTIFNLLFYSGISIINYIPEEEFSRIRIKNDKKI